MFAPRIFASAIALTLVGHLVKAIREEEDDETSALGSGDLDYDASHGPEVQAAESFLTSNASMIALRTTGSCYDIITWEGPNSCDNTAGCKEISCGRSKIENSDKCCDGQIIVEKDLADQAFESLFPPPANCGQDTTFHRKQYDQETGEMYDNHAMLFGYVRKAFTPREETIADLATHCLLVSSVSGHAFISGKLQDALASVPSGGAVADIGSGTGFLLAAFATLTGKNVTVVGLDIEDSAIEQADTLLTAVRKWDEERMTDTGELTKNWKEVPKTVNKNIMDSDFSYPQQFSVINVGFATSRLPDEILDAAADDAVILMPICKQYPSGHADAGKIQMHVSGFRCWCWIKLRRFTKRNGELVAPLDGEVVRETLGRYYYVALDGDVRKTHMSSLLSVQDEHDLYRQQGVLDGDGEEDINVVDE